MEQKRNCDIDLRLGGVMPLLSPGLRHYPCPQAEHIPLGRGAEAVAPEGQ